MTRRRSCLALALALAAGCSEEGNPCEWFGETRVSYTKRSESLVVDGAPAGARCRVTADDYGISIDCEDPSVEVGLAFETPAEVGATAPLGEGLAVDRDRRCGPPPGGSGYPVVLEGTVTRLETREGREGPAPVLRIHARLEETWSLDAEGAPCLVFPAAELDLVIEGERTRILEC